MGKKDVPNTDVGMILWGGRFVAALGESPESVGVTRDAANDALQTIARLEGILEALAASPATVGPTPLKRARQMVSAHLRGALARMSAAADAHASMTNDRRAELGLSPVNVRIPDWKRRAAEAA
jgi:hypothetical protein